MVALASPLFAQAPSVAIVASAHPLATDCRFSTVEDYLVATGAFSSVSTLDCISTTPTLAELSAFDAVLTWSNFDYHDSALLGDVMADYVDAGGGVVVGVFASTASASGLHLQGRWLTGGYEVIKSGEGTSSSPASLGALSDPTHPTVQGVTSLTASLAFRPIVGTALVQGAVVADWDDGSILVAAGAMPGRVDLGLYPPSSDCASSMWDVAGDGDILVANSLLFVANGTSLSPGMPYCPGVTNSTGVAGGFLAEGSSLASANTLTLGCTNLPQFSFSFFIVSQAQGLVMNPGGSTGNLCLAGSIGRYVGPGQIQQANLAGTTSLTLDLTAIPTPLGFVSVAPGDTWNFQACYRDSNSSGATSNFTNGFRIDFI